MPVVAAVLAVVTSQYLIFDNDNISLCPYLTAITPSVSITFSLSVHPLLLS